MNGKPPDPGIDFSFGDGDLDSDDWITADFDSSDVESDRVPVASIGAILKQVRRQIGLKGISQDEMAQRLGIPERTYKSYETQETLKVPAEVLRRVAATTEVDAEFILTGRMRRVDHGPLLDDAFQLAEYLVRHIHDGKERLTYEDIQEVVFRVLTARDERRRDTGDQSLQYDRSDIAEAVWEHTEYSWNFRLALSGNDENR